MKYKIASLFSGIGGFEEGIKKSKLNGDVVFASEIDKYARISYSANFGSDNLHGDITILDEKCIPDHDILVAGFPCQAFSIAGKRSGFEDSRGTLFFDVVRILKAKNPKYVLLENVKNLLSHDNGKTIKVILETLNELEYTVDFSVLNSVNWGVPQHRERTYILGIKKHKTEKYKLDNESVRLIRLKSELNSINYQGFNFFDSLCSNSRNTFLIDIVDKSVDNKFIISNEKIQCFISNFKDESCDNCSKIIKLFDLPRELWNDLERQRRVYSIRGISPTVLARSDATKIFMNGAIRKLTPIENMRAQGFGDSFIKKIKSTGISDTQLYKQSGNAVSPPVITGIINQLLKYMEE